MYIDNILDLIELKLFITAFVFLNLPLLEPSPTPGEEIIEKGTYTKGTCPIISIPPPKAKIEIYVRQACPYCVMAKKLLASKGQEWKEIDLDKDPDRTQEMIERTEGRMTVPEIFINNNLIGGYDDLAAKEATGELDALLE